MINPKDIELLDTEEGMYELDPEFIEEFGPGKGDDEDGSDTDIQ